MDQDALVEAACGETVAYSKDRNAVLIFASGVQHARHIQRVLQEKHGVECGLVCAEMISANGLVQESAKTLGMLESVPEEKPLAIQIFGSDPALMAKAAAMVEAAGADVRLR